jgi:trans-aconitate 2-methyltransferase
VGREWDADVYHRVSGPQEAMALEVLGRLRLRGDETVLDAGCGSGRVTELLLTRLPHGRVIGVDASPTMIEHARAQLAPYGDRVELHIADLTTLSLDAAVDAVFSTAALHWVLDHDALWERMAVVLRSEGRLVAQFGGIGNIARAVDRIEALADRPRYREHFADWSRPWRFRDPEETEARLVRSGFTDVECWLTEFRYVPDDPEGFFREVVAGAHLELLPADLREEFLAELLSSFGGDFEMVGVRLNVCAIRSV